MAFALWIDEEIAWAQGLHEYRPTGVAVISVTDRFRPRDFDVRRPAPPRAGKSFAGLFASLGDVNQRLGRSQGKQKKSRKGLSVTPAWI